MSLSVSWPRRKGGERYLIANVGTSVSFSLDEALKRELERVGAKNVRLEIVWSVRGKPDVPQSLAWPRDKGALSVLDHVIPIDAIGVCRAQLVADDLPAGAAVATEFGFFPRRFFVVSRAILLAALAGLALYFAPLLARLGGNWKQDLLLAWATPAAAALVALLSSELLESRNPPLLGILVYPWRACLAVCMLTLLACLAAHLGFTVVTNATKTPLYFGVGVERTPLEPGRSVVLFGRAPQTAEYWSKALDQKLADSRCIVLPNGATREKCNPHPAEGSWSRSLRLAGRVSVHCKGIQWPGWEGGAVNASFKGATRALGSVWVDSGDDCEAKLADATVTVTQQLGSETVRVTGKFPWKAETSNEGSSAAKFVFEERNPSAALVSRRFDVGELPFCPAGAAGGLYTVYPASEREGAETPLGTLRCGAGATCIQAITLRTSNLSELTVESSDAGLAFLSNFVFDPALKGTQTQAFACVPGAKNAAAVAVGATFLGDQEPTTFLLQSQLLIQELALRAAVNGITTQIGKASCAPAVEGVLWQRWSLELGERARKVRQVEVSSPTSRSVWTRNERLSEAFERGFPSAWLCGSTWSSAALDGKAADLPARLQIKERPANRLPAYRMQYPSRGGRPCAEKPAPSACEASSRTLQGLGLDPTKYGSVEECACEAAK
ncbi:MAG: hypothetical protein ACOY0T_06855 [Myxococcota bacterium]